MGAEPAQRRSQWQSQRGLQVLLGMKHLEAKRVVHRNLAARNVMVASERPLRVKVADFARAVARRHAVAWIDSSGASLAEACRPRRSSSPDCSKYT